MIWTWSCSTPLTAFATSPAIARTLSFVSTASSLSSTCTDALALGPANPSWDCVEPGLMTTLAFLTDSMLRIIASRRDWSAIWNRFSICHLVAKMSDCSRNFQTALLLIVLSPASSRTMRSASSFGTRISLPRTSCFWLCSWNLRRMSCRLPASTSAPATRTIVGTELAEPQTRSRTIAAAETERMTRCVALSAAHMRPMLSRARLMESMTNPSSSPLFYIPPGGGSSCDPAASPIAVAARFLLDAHPLDFLERVDQLVPNLQHRLEGDLRLFEGHRHLILRRLTLRVLLQHLVGILLELVHARQGVLQDLLERALPFHGRRLGRQSGRDRAPE